MSRSLPTDARRGFQPLLTGPPFPEPASAGPHRQAITESTTAYDWLSFHARLTPDALAVAAWRDGELSAEADFRGALREADGFARGLVERGAQPGDRVLICLPNEPCFSYAVLGCIAAGTIAVPAPVPTAARVDAFRDRIRGIVEDCDPVLLITRSAWTARLAQTLPAEHADAIVSYDEIMLAAVTDADGGREAHPSGPGPRDARKPGCEIALLQYTSGSTGRPRGVVITHAALRASCAQAAQAYAEHRGDVAVTWVPLFHDMGLITGVMRPLFSGYASVLLRPEDYVRAPACWPEAVHSCRGTLSSAPNFAFELCVRKVDPVRVEALDLSCWRVARNAGEVVRAETMDRFSRHFAAARFPREALCPSYGLAEATLTVTACAPGAPPARLSVLRSDLEAGIVTPVRAEDRAGPDRQPPGVELISSGAALPGTRVSAGDGEGGVGEILVSGPQLSAGLWNRGAEGVSPGGWLRTGDLGFVHGGQLYVLGRIDDTLVHHGRNFFLSDIAAACSTVTGVRPGRLAAFVVRDGATGTESVHLVAERRTDTARVPPETADEIRRRLVSALELFVHQIRFVEPGAIPVTTSGKVRVSEVRRRVEAGRL